jgi:hypothetical protein
VNMVLDRIEALLGNCAHVGEVERTLTDGYAAALALEGERMRVERQMDGVTASLEVGDPEGARTLSALAERRARLDRDLTHLRDRLGALKARRHELRTVVPQPGFS